MNAKDDFKSRAPDLVRLAAAGDPDLSVAIRHDLAALARWDLPIGVKLGIVDPLVDRSTLDARPVAWVGVLPRRLDGVNRWMQDWRLRQQARKSWGRLLALAICDAEAVASIESLKILGRYPTCRIRMAVQVVRFVPSVRNFIRDDDGLAGAPKQLYDAMKDVGLIFEDRREWLAMRPPVQDVTPIADTPITVFLLWPLFQEEDRVHVHRSIHRSPREERRPQNRRTEKR